MNNCSLEEKIKNNNGFTLMELLLVTSIVITLYTVSLPAFYNVLNRQSLICTTQQMVSDIRYLQQLAMTKENEVEAYYIYFYMGEDNPRYVLYKGSNQVIKEVHLPPGIEIENTTFNENRLFINTKGLGFPTGGSVLLRHRSSKKYRFVIVASITGRVRDSDYPPK